VLCLTRARFDLHLDTDTGRLIAGHVSMLFDIVSNTLHMVHNKLAQVLSSDEKYLISCDRDEKIRVSHFPNAFDIEAYCLGHTEWVVFEQA
jgi:tRNA (guanine-N(7)-)-methyltransferase subunit TRM82